MDLQMSGLITSLPGPPPQDPRIRKFSSDSSLDFDLTPAFQTFT